VEVLCVDDSNDLDMGYEVTKSKKSISVSFKKKVNQKLRMEGGPYLGYSRSNRKQIIHNVDRGR